MIIFFFWSFQRTDYLSVNLVELTDNLIIIYFLKSVDRVPWSRALHRSQQQLQSVTPQTVSVSFSRIRTPVSLSGVSQLVYRQFCQSVNLITLIFSHLHYGSHIIFSERLIYCNINDDNKINN